MQLAEEGGRRIMEIYDGPREDWNLSFKDDDSPLTGERVPRGKLPCPATRPRVRAPAPVPQPLTLPATP